MYLTKAEIQRLRALPVGLRTNKVLYYLLEPRIFGYWAFLEPKHKGSELADVLIWWDDVVFLIEAKSKATGEGAKKSWLRGRLKEAIQGLNDRAVALREGRVDTLRNKWRGEVAWDPTAVKDYYGVVILNAVSEPFEPRELATDAFRSTKIPIQVFSLFDFAELLRLVSTAWDLVVILRAPRCLRTEIQAGTAQRTWNLPGHPWYLGRAMGARRRSRTREDCSGIPASHFERNPRDADCHRGWL